MEQQAQFYRGPNVYADRSTLVIAADFGKNAGLLDADFSALKKAPDFPSCAPMLVQAWSEALHASVDSLGALIVKLSMNLLASFAIEAGEGRILQREGSRLLVTLPCDDPQLGMAAWKLAFHIVAAQTNDGSALASMHDNFLDFRKLGLNKSYNQSTMAIVRLAHQRGIPAYRLRASGEIIQLGQGVHRQLIFETLTQHVRALSRMISLDKLMCQQLFLNSGLPVLPMHEVFDATAAAAAAEKIGFPVVVKPCRGAKGKGVSTGLNSRDEVIRAFSRAASPRDSVIVERHADGFDYRLLVVGGRLIAAAKRVPAEVVGDGIHTIAQLVEILNRDPQRGIIDFEALLVQVVIDQEAADLLAQQSMTVRSVPASGVHVPLRLTANISRGGTAVDVTELIHADNRTMAQQAAKVIGLDVAGIDFISRDISRSWKESGGAILEINTPPGLRPHWLANPDQDVVGPILDQIFPQGKQARIPTAAITGSLGKTTTARMVECILTQQGLCTGVCTTQGVWIGGQQLHSGDCAGGGYARQLLMSPLIEAGVFEIARGGLVKKGMTLDSCDVGAVLNIGDNHLGLDGVSSRAEMARVKSIVVRNCRKMAVLNAEDPLCMAMIPDVRSARICLISTRANQTTLQDHVKSGGCAVVLRDDGDEGKKIVLIDGGIELTAIPAHEIPATRGGQSLSKVSNALFATAIAYGLGVEPAMIGDGLAQFHSTYEQNPGRFNISDQHPFRVIIDWADGPVAIETMVKSIAAMETPGRKVLLFSVAGNRPDEFIIGAGLATAGYFDAYLCCNSYDLRGRAVDETPGLLRKGLIDGGVSPEKISIVSDEIAILKKLLTAAEPGDLIVVMPYRIHEAWQTIQEHVSL